MIDHKLVFHTVEKNWSPILIYQTFLFPATKQNSQNQDSKVMCFPLAKSTDESDAVIAVWDKWLGGLLSLREHPSEQLPCCEGGEGRSRLPALAPHCIPRCWHSSWHSGRAQGESVLKVNAMSKGRLGVLGGGRRINLCWTPMEHHAKCWAYKTGLRTAIKCAGPSAKWKWGMPAPCSKLIKNFRMVTAEHSTKHKALLSRSHVTQKLPAPEAGPRWNRKLILSRDCWFRGQDKGIRSDDLMLHVWWGWHEMLWEQRLI